MNQAETAAREHHLAFYRWLAAGWSRFWFKPALGFNLGVSRFVFFALISWFYYDRYSGDALAMWALVPDQFWEPVSYFRALPFLPTHSYEALSAIALAWHLALFLSCVGLFTRYSTKVAAVLGLIYLGYPHNFGKIHHSDHMVTVVLCILAWSRCGDYFSLDQHIKALRGKGSLAPIASAEYRWPLRFIQTILMLSYFEAGYSKLTNSGLEWVFSDNIVNLLMAWGVPRGVYVATHFPMLCRIMGGWTLIAQLMSLTALFSWRAACIFVPALFFFHVGSRLTMGDAVAFTALMMCYTFWIPWEWIWKKTVKLRQ